MNKTLRLVVHHAAQNPLVTLREFFWKYLVYRVWPILTGAIRLASKRFPSRNPSNFFPTDCIMLVHNAESPSHWDSVGPDQTKALEIWMREVVGVRNVRYLGDLKEEDILSPSTVVVANYDWIVNAVFHPLSGGFVRLWRVVGMAQRSGAPVWCHNFDLFSARYSFYTSLLAGLTGGSTVFLQNTVAQAEKFGIVNPSGPHFWIFPPSVQRSWAVQTSLDKRKPLVLIAQSGDERRKVYYGHAFERFEVFGYQPVATIQKLEWAEYVSLVQSAKISCTTSWLQPLFLKGPPRFRRRLADGVITHRVLEAFSTGSLLVTNPIDALLALGFFPGEHFVAAPPDEAGWTGWNLPDEKTVIAIADKGHERFVELLESEWKRHEADLLRYGL